MRYGEVVVRLGNRKALSQYAHEPIVGVVVDVGDATPGEHFEIVPDEQAPEKRIGVCLVGHWRETLAFTTTLVLGLTDANSTSWRLWKRRSWRLVYQAAASVGPPRFSEMVG